MTLKNPRFARPALRLALRILSAVAMAVGLVFLAGAVMSIPDRDALIETTGKVRAADPVVLRPAVPPAHARNVPPTLAVNIVLANDAGETLTLTIHEPRLTAADAPGLIGHTATALYSSITEVWELTTPDRVYFTYDETRATQAFGQRVALLIGPLLIALGVFGWRRLSRAPDEEAA